MFIILAHILSYDLWFYISHRILHHKLFYKYHRLHHQALYPTFLDTYKGHYFESLFQSLGFFFPLLIIDFHIYSFLIALCITNLRGILRHDSRTIWLIGNHHLLHHQYPKYNYGDYYLDKLFDTAYPNYNHIKKGLLYL